MFEKVDIASLKKVLYQDSPGYANKVIEKFLYWRKTKYVTSISFDRPAYLHIF